MANKKPIVLNSSGQLEQIQSGDVIDPSFYTAGSGIQVAAAGGTVDAITADFSPDISLTDKQLCAVVSAGRNTSTTPTFAPDGLTARTITKNGGKSLNPGDIGDAGDVILLEYNSANTRWELLNPTSAYDFTATNMIARNNYWSGAF